MDNINTVVFFIVVYISTILAAEGVLVEISNGKLQGFLDKSYKNRTFSSFEGIPYARPPVGELRFEPPQESSNWTGILMANTKYECLQLLSGAPGVSIVAGTEDCLYINVYTPRENPTSSDGLPVIVHIHAGAFTTLSAHAYAGPKYLMDKDVILVTMNYRLGPFGFLSTEDEVVPGNNGMKDQVLSLKWIQKNIKYFGGDPNAVTLTGMSAGGASVHLHYFSPLSKGLFHRGFSESGNALNPWVLQEGALEKAKRLADAVGCPSVTSKEVISCLKTKSGSEIVEGTKIFSLFPFTPTTPFAPVVEVEKEGAFINDFPYKMLVEKRVADLPWVHSVCEQEGYLLPIIFADRLNDFFNNFDKFAPHLLEYNYTIDENQKDDVLQKIAKHYFPKTKNFDGLGKLAGDRLFFSGSDTAVKLQSKANKSPVHFTIFGYKGQYSLCNMFAKDNCDKVGATHGDDAFYYLNAPIVTPLKLSKNDEKMKDIYVGWLTNFAKDNHNHCIIEKLISRLILQVETPNLLCYECRHNSKKRKVKMSGVEWEAVKGAETLESLFVKCPNDIKMEYIKDFGSNSFWKEIHSKENENLLKH